MSAPHLSFFKRKGIVVNDTHVLLYGQMLTGRKYIPKASGVVELEKQWAKQVLPFAYQTVVKVLAHKHNEITLKSKLWEVTRQQCSILMQKTVTQRGCCEADFIKIPMKIFSMLKK